MKIFVSEGEGECESKDERRVRVRVKVNDEGILFRAIQDIIEAREIRKQTYQHDDK